MFFSAHSEMSGSILESSSESCCICLDPLEENVTTTPCSHSFHEACLQSWTEQKNECPICRERLDNRLITRSEAQQPRETIILVNHASSRIALLRYYTAAVSILSYVNLCLYFALDILSVEYNLFVGALGLIFSTQVTRLGLRSLQCLLYSCFFVFAHFTYFTLTLSNSSIHKLARIIFGYVVILFQLVFMCLSTKMVQTIVIERQAT